MDSNYVPAPDGDLPLMKLPQDVVDFLLQASPPPKKNYYKCHAVNCCHFIITIDIHRGVTPMLLACDKCGGRMVSGGYPGSEPPLGFLKLYEVLEWYRPSVDEWEKQSAEMKDHVVRGGLMKRVHKVAD